MSGLANIRMQADVLKDGTEASGCMPIVVNVFRMAQELYCPDAEVMFNDMYVFSDAACKQTLTLSALPVRSSTRPSYRRSIGPSALLP